MLQKGISLFLKLVLLLGFGLAPTTLVAPAAVAALDPATSLSTTSLPTALLTEVTKGQTLRITGSDNMAAINQLLKQRYEKQFPGAEVRLKTSDTETALEELLNDEIDLAAIGRPLTPAEKAKGLMEIPISREKIAIIVGQDNPFRGDLTVEQLSQIFRGEITDWSEVGGAAGPIRIIDRPALSDTRLALQRYKVFKDANFAGENVVQLETDDTAAVIRALDRDGISYAIASQLTAQDQARIVKLVVTLDVLPEDPLYPYAQPRSYVYKQNPNSAAQAFLGFATAKPGQAAVAAAKLTEAKAVAEGEQIAFTPVGQVAPALDAPTGEPAITNDWFRFWWIFLPLILLGLLIGWLTTRFRPQSPTEEESPAPPPTPTDQTKAPETPSVIEGTPTEAETKLPEIEPVDSEPVDSELDSAAPVAENPVAEEEPVSEEEPPVSEPIPMAELVPVAEEEPSTEIAASESADQPVVVEPAIEEVIVAELIEAELVDAEVDTELANAELVNAELVEVGEMAIKAEPPAPEHVTSEQIEPEPSRSEPATPEAIATELIRPQELAAPIEIAPPDLTQPLDADGFKQAFLYHLYRRNTTLETATTLERYMALANLLCERMLALNPPETYLSQGRLVGEIAAEFMPGPHLENSLLCLGLMDQAQQAMQELGLDLKQLIDAEEEPGLGKGGLGRLMVCYLDSLATLNIPAIGYGIRYEYGIFDQEIQDGWQVEITDTWLRNGNPWEVERPEKSVNVNLGGSTSAYIDDQGRYRVRWMPAETVRGIPYDTPIPGYLSQPVSLLRLWRADSGDLCKVLYPIDSELQGKALRLKQQFFLVACALQDAMRLHLDAGGQPETIHERLALQLNDTDPTLAIAELMRLLVDEYGVGWEQAWDVTQRTFAYTNHSLMPETLDDQWTVGVFGHFLPRHLEIIYEINYRLLETIKAAYPDDDARLNRMSLIDERGERYVRLNYLAAVGSHAVNGISHLHTELLKQTVFRDFYDLYPDKFSSKTNGISPRRFLLQGNPQLARLITSKLGNSWIVNLDRLKELEPYAADPGFCSEWLRIKQVAKQALATQIQQQTGVEVDPNSLFDVQATVIHEYKRQHLNLLHILTLYNRIKANPHLEITPRTFVFAGKAAPDYSTAKLIIKLIHAVADVVNVDADVRGRLKVVFLKDFNIKTAQSIYPAIDLSEHISLAGTEAADTGNMISALNAALIIGTPDGSNIELRDAVGAENFFQFGLTASQVQQRREDYNPMELYYTNAELKRAIDLLTSGELANGDTELFRPLTNLLLWDDHYMLLADYPPYIACQERVSQTYRDPEEWTRMSILTTARMGRFSSDRAVREYAQEIWDIKPAQWATSEPPAAEESIPAKK
jgi:starch phosphorylase